MPISLLFCHSVPPVSRQSRHRSGWRMETDIARCGTRVNTPRTCVIDAEALVPRVAEVCVARRRRLGEKSNSKGVSQGIGKVFMCRGDNDNGDDRLLMHPPLRGADQRISANGCWCPTWASVSLELPSLPTRPELLLLNISSRFLPISTNCHITGLNWAGGAYGRLSLIHRPSASQHRTRWPHPSESHQWFNPKVTEICLETQLSRCTTVVIKVFAWYAFCPCC